MVVTLVVQLRSSDSKISGFTRPLVIGFVRCGFVFSASLESGFKHIGIRCRVRWMPVDGSRIRKEKGAKLCPSFKTQSAVYYRFYIEAIRNLFYHKCTVQLQDRSDNCMVIWYLISVFIYQLGVDYHDIHPCVSVTKDLFTRTEGHPSKRVTLAFRHFLFLFIFVMLIRQLGLPGSASYVTLSAC